MGSKLWFINAECRSGYTCVCGWLHLVRFESLDWERIARGRSIDKAPYIRSIWRWQRTNTNRASSSMRWRLIWLETFNWPGISSRSFQSGYSWLLIFILNSNRTEGGNFPCLIALMVLVCRIILLLALSQCRRLGEAAQILKEALVVALIKKV